MEASWNSHTDCLGESCGATSVSIFEPVLLYRSSTASSDFIEKILSCTGIEVVWFSSGHPIYPPHSQGFLGCPKSCLVYPLFLASVNLSGFFMLLI